MSPAELRVFQAVLAVAHGRLTKAGHVAIAITNEGLGYCNQRVRYIGRTKEDRRTVGTCAPTCQHVRATLEEATMLLARGAEVEAPVQLELLREAS